MARKPKQAPRSAEGRAQAHFKRSDKATKASKRSERVAAGAAVAGGVSLLTGPVGAAVGSAAAAVVAGNAIKQAHAERADAGRARRQGAASHIATAARNKKTRTDPYTDSKGRVYAQGRAITRNK